MIAGPELARKLVHIAFGGFAFAIGPLGFRGALALALAAVAHNALLLPRYGRRWLWRDAESGLSPGVLLYPVTVALLLLLFARRLEVAAAAWAILACGDGTAALAGRALGAGWPLPWNPRKSWAGTLAYFLFGAAAGSTLLLWTAPGRYPPGFALAVAAAAAAFAALLESAPQRLDDNLGPPLAAALLLYGLLLTAGHWSALATPEVARRAAIGLAVNVALALVALAGRAVSRSGAAAGILLGTLIWAALGWRGFLPLFAFVALATLATRVGFEEKARRRIAQVAGGRRGAGSALAKISVPALCALLAAATDHATLFALAFAGALATAAADTCSSEIGQVYGRRAYLVTTLRPVRRGTEGAVSLAGTLAGLAAALVIGALGAGAGLFPGRGVALVVVAAFFATTVESLLGATLETRGLLDNDGVNFASSLAGALAAVGCGVLAGI